MAVRNTVNLSGVEGSPVTFFFLFMYINHCNHVFSFLYLLETRLKISALKEKVLCQFAEFLGNKM